MEEGEVPLGRGVEVEALNQTLLKAGEVVVQRSLEMVVEAEALLLVVRCLLQEEEEEAHLKKY